MMASYMQVAPNTTLAFDLYSNLCAISAKFKELWNKGQQEQPNTGYETEMNTKYTQTQQNMQNTQDMVERYVFCGQCGTKHEAGTKFCGTCGEQLAV